MVEATLYTATWQKNLDVRSQMTYIVNGLVRSIPLWVIAAELGVHENTLRMWMRKEMQPDRKERVLAAIQTVRADLEHFQVREIHPPER
jgi:hypothetical protein